MGTVIGDRIRPHSPVGSSLAFIVVVFVEVYFDHKDLFCEPYIARVARIFVVLVVFRFAYERC